MSATEILNRLRTMPAAERLRVLEQIWDEFADAALGLTPAQQAELYRRLEDHQHRPDYVILWSEIKQACRRP